MDPAEVVVNQMSIMNRKFRNSCIMVIILNHRIEAYKLRYERAKSNNHRSFRYTHRIKLSAYEGVRNMFYEYACMKADELEKLQEELIRLRGRGFVEGEGDSDLENGGNTFVSNDVDSSDEDVDSDNDSYPISSDSEQEEAQDDVQESCPENEDRQEQDMDANWSAATLQAISTSKMLSKHT